MIIQIIFRSQVIKGSKGLIIVFGEFGLDGDLGASEVTDLVAFAVSCSNQDVLRFQVQMHQLLFQQFQKGCVHLGDEAKEFAFGVVAMGELSAQGAGTELHNEVESAFVGVVDGGVVLDDVVALHLLQVLDLAVGHVLLQGMHLHLLYCHSSTSSPALYRPPDRREGTLTQHFLEIVERTHALYLRHHVVRFAHTVTDRQTQSIAIPNYAYNHPSISYYDRTIPPSIASNRRIILDWVIIFLASYCIMYEPHTLQQYIQMRNLQRRRENCLLNEAKNFPNPLSLDKEKKIDQLLMEIFDYIRSAIGEGPIFQRFRMMMQNLYRTFQRELSEFHNIGIAKKFKTDQRYIEDMKKANTKLNDYLAKCEEDNKAITEKYEKLAKDNKDNNRNMIMINKERTRVEVEDNFDDEEVVERTEKIGRIGEPELKNKVSPASSLFPKKNDNETNIRILKPPELKGTNDRQPAKIPNFFTKI